MQQLPDDRRRTGRRVPPASERHRSEEDRKRRQLGDRQAISAGPIDRGQAERLRPAYHLSLEIEIHNQGPAAQQLPISWTAPPDCRWRAGGTRTRRIPRRFSAVGARDVAWRTERSGTADRCAQIYKEAKKARRQRSLAAHPLVSAGTAAGGPVRGRRLAVFLRRVADRSGRRTCQGDLRGRALPSRPDRSARRRASGSRRPIPRFGWSVPIARWSPVSSTRRSSPSLPVPRCPRCWSNTAWSDFIAYGWFAMIARPCRGCCILRVAAAGELRPGDHPADGAGPQRHDAAQPQSGQERADDAGTGARDEADRREVQERHGETGIAQRELFAKHNYNPFGGCC
jgi:hypothetical protein